MLFIYIIMCIIRGTTVRLCRTETFYDSRAVEKLKKKLKLTTVSTTQTLQYIPTTESFMLFWSFF